VRRKDWGASCYPTHPRRNCGWMGHQHFMWMIEMNLIALRRNRLPCRGCPVPYPSTRPFRHCYR
jgi:hypothetical protein